MLDKLNTKAVGFAGITIGTGTIVGAVYQLFHLLSDPNYLVSLLNASVDLAHHAMTQTDIMVYAQLVGAGMAVIGALVVSLVAANVGKSIFKNYPGNGNATGGASTDTKDKGST